MQHPHGSKWAHWRIDTSRKPAEDDDWRVVRGRDGTLAVHRHGAIVSPHTDRKRVRRQGVDYELVEHHVDWPHLDDPELAQRLSRDGRAPLALLVDGLGLADLL